MPAEQFYSFLALLVAILGFLVYVVRKLTRVEQGLMLQGRTMNGILGLVGMMIQMMHKRVSLSDEELKELISVYTTIAQVSPHGSPLTLEENGRLNSYLARARKGDLFTADEVEDYNNLVRKLEREKKNDPSVWPLVALGAFLFGLFGASQKKK